MKTCETCEHYPDCKADPDCGELKVCEWYALQVGQALIDERNTLAEVED